MQAIILSKTGDAGVLKIKDAEIGTPKKGEILIRHTAIGINFFDVSFRRGQYKINDLDKKPVILGTEACGIVEAIGQGVVEFKIGDRVAYATGPIGAYAEKRIINQRFVVTVPKGISDVQAAGSLLKGMMAHSLLFRVYIASRAKRILVHAAAGGLGQFLCQWANHIGLEVIGTVGDDAKIAKAKANGCHHVINYKKNNFVEEVAKITQSAGVGMVLDGIGKATLEKSLDCLWPMGICATFGEASGNCDKLDLNYLSANSLFLTRPTLAMYKSNRVELVLGAADVFTMIQQGVLKPQITTYAFKDVAKAHQALESRASTGSLVLTL